MDRPEPPHASGWIRPLTVQPDSPHPSWRSWFRSHNGRFTIRAMPVFRATVNSAQDISHLLLMLAQEQQQTS